MRREAILILAVCASLMAVAVWQLSEPLKVNCDQATFLYGSHLMLHGARLYVDFVEFNPPMIYYLCSLPEALSVLTHIDDIICFKIWMVLLSCLSVFLSMFVIRKRLSVPEERPFLVIIILITACFGFCLGREFGQRDHIVVLCFLPYFFARWLRWQDQPVALTTAIACGILAGLGISLKPYFLALPLVPELGCAVLKRKIRPLFSAENFGCGSVIFAYLLSLLLLPPLERDGLRHMVGCLVGMQPLYVTPLILVVLLYDRLWPYPFLLTGLSLAFARLARKAHSLVFPLVLYVFAGYISAFAQMKYWEYYKIPLFSAVSMLMGIECVAFLRVVLVAAVRDRTKAVGLLNRGGTALSALVFVAMLIYSIPRLPAAVSSLWIEQPEPGRSPSPALSAELDRLASLDKTLAVLKDASKPGDQVLVLNMINFPIFPAILQLNVRQAFRCHFPFELLSWKLACMRAAANHDVALKNECDERMHKCMDELISDVQSRKPKVMVVRFVPRPNMTADIAYRALMDDSSFARRLFAGYHETARYEQIIDGVNPFFIVYKPDKQDSGGLPQSR